MIKRILVGLSGTPYSSVATQRAIELAQLHEAELTGITIVDISKLSKVGPVPLGGAAYAHMLEDHRIKVTRERVEESIIVFESSCQEAGVKYNVMRETGNSLDLVIAHARYNDLLICGLRGLSDYRGVEDHEAALIRLIGEDVRPIIAVSQQFRQIRRAVIAYSGSMESAKAMKRFIQLRPWPNVLLQVVCFGKEASEARQLLRDAALYCKSHGHQVEVQYIPGGARELILTHAKEWRADLIVMGNSVRKVLLHRVIGATTLHVIRNAELPLFLCQ